MQKGWFQIGFERDFKSSINVVDVENNSLIVISKNDSWRTFTSTCPHRGANLGLGGQLIDSEIICPFHGCKIGIDSCTKDGYVLKEYPTLAVGGCIFINPSYYNIEPFQNYIKNIDINHYIVPGFEMTVNVPPVWVIENAFDQLHFRTVHAILNEPTFNIISFNQQFFSIEGTFIIPPSSWQNAYQDKKQIEVGYSATAFSPYLVISHLGGLNEYYVITSSRKGKDGMCKISLSIAIKASGGIAPSVESCKYLLDQSKKGLLLDKIIWENLSFNTNNIRAEEKSIIGFQKFCKQFS